MLMIYEYGETKSHYSLIISKYVHLDFHGYLSLKVFSHGQTEIRFWDLKISVQYNAKLNQIIHMAIYKTQFIYVVLIYSLHYARTSSTYLSF